MTKGKRLSRLKLKISLRIQLLLSVWAREAFPWISRAVENDAA